VILSGAGIVLPDRLLPSGSLVIEGAHIVDISEGPRAGSAGPGKGGSDTHVDLTGHLIVPGFIDVHIHGVEGHDGLAAAGGVAEMSRRLPRYGVTGFCPTTIACGPDQLAMLLSAIREAQRAAVPGASRVLKAHLESNFINPDYRGAQPLDCIRRPPPSGGVEDLEATVEDGFSGADIMAVIEAFRAEVGIVTLAPEMPGGIEFTRALVAARVSETTCIGRVTWSGCAATATTISWVGGMTRSRAGDSASNSARSRQSSTRIRRSWRR
jgi:N-acetylglucosamine-6-phosphate deacetylase